MYKKLKISIIIFTLIICFVSINIYAEPGETISITRWIVDETIKENGDIEVEEDITFRFDTKLKGVFREISLKHADSIDNIRVSRVIYNDTVAYKRINGSNNEKNNVYTIENKNDKLIINVLDPSENQEKTYRFKYTLKNVSTRYEDVGEVYSSFLGIKDDILVDYFVSSITFDSKHHLDENKLKIFTHGAKGAIVKLEGYNTFKITIKNVQASDNIEARVLFPPELIPKSDKFVNENVLKNILQQENDYKKELEEQEIERSKNKSLFNSLSYAINASALIALAIILFSFRKKTDLDDIKDENFNIKCLSPAVVISLMPKVDWYTIFSVTIFDLARRRYISIKYKGKYKSDIYNFKLQRLKYDNVLLQHEKIFMELLFDIIGDGNNVAIDKISSKSQLSEYKKKYLEWKKAINNEIKDMGYLDLKSRILGKIMIVISLVILVVALISIIYNANIGFITLILAIAFAVYGGSILNRKSYLGRVQSKRWIEFKEEFKKRSETLDISDLEFGLDRSLIYALGLGISGDILKRFQIFSSENASPDDWHYWYYVYDKDGQNVLKKSIKHI